MKQAEFESKTFEEVMDQLDAERNDITTYDRLKSFAIYKINNDDFLVAISILEAINKDPADWYEYDFCMGTLQDPSPIKCKEDVEHLIED